MTAQIAGFVTRADAGLRAPKSFSRKITPHNGGCAVHYGGPAQPCAAPDADHALCIKTWRGWQNYHMNTHGWADIAYTSGFCNHGYVFAGRGLGVRTAANGTNFGNQNFYAFTWLGGEGQNPTQEAYDALDWLIKDAREEKAADAVRPHNSFKSTGCPGGHCADRARELDGKLILSEPVRPLPPGVDRVLTERIQELLRVATDGFWGAETDSRADLMVKACQSRVGYPANKPSVHYIQGLEHVIGVVPDGQFSWADQAQLHEWVKKLQGRLSLSSDGLWGPQTDGRFNEIRLANRGQF